uniref:Uncharacterized protein n=1 Tax=Zooxanthella nutricula TaxID=1333877 RepID=A0A7S2LBI0_9DINO
MDAKWASCRWSGEQRRAGRAGAPPAWGAHDAQSPNKAIVAQQDISTYKAFLIARAAAEAHQRNINTGIESLDWQYADPECGLWSCEQCPGWYCEACMATTMNPDAKFCCYCGRLFDVGA